MHYQIQRQLHERRVVHRLNYLNFNPIRFAFLRIQSFSL